MKLTEEVAHMGGKGGTYRVLVGIPEGQAHLEDLGVDGRIIKQVFNKYDRGWINLTQYRDSWWALVNAIMNLWLHNLREFLDKLTNCELLWKDSVRWR
jgi:hypothetical protein